MEDNVIATRTISITQSFFSTGYMFTMVQTNKEVHNNKKPKEN